MRKHSTLPSFQNAGRPELTGHNSDPYDNLCGKFWRSIFDMLAQNTASITGIYWNKCDRYYY